MFTNGAVTCVIKDAMQKKRTYVEMFAKTHNISITCMHAYSKVAIARLTMPAYDVHAHTGCKRE